MEDDDLEDDWDEDEGCVAVTEEEYYAELRERGIDTREWDPAYYCLRRASTGLVKKPAVFVKRETLLDAIRIERLRWKAYLNYARHMDRQEALTQEMKALPDQECFIPVDEEELQQSIEEFKKRGEPLSEEDIHRYSRPRRAYVQDDYSGETWSSYDDRFWDYEEPEHDKQVAMEVIAAAGCLGEWELVTLPAREKRAQDPVKLDLGARWQYETRRGLALQDKCYLLNELLTASILNSDLLPEGPAHVQKLVRVRLNERIYFFKIGRHHKSAEHGLWPVPSDYDEVVVTDKLRPAGTVR